MELQNKDLIIYDMGEGVSAFTTKKTSILPFPVVQAHQTHSLNIAVVTDPDTTREQLEGIDALITSTPGVAVGARTADCIPVLLYDEKNKVVAAVHSGWRGTVGKISALTVEKLSSEYGTDPSELKAVIGPGIGPESFQVGKEVVDAFSKAGFPMERIHSFEGEKVEGTMKGGDHINLWEAVRWTLESAGIKNENIQISGICSYENSDYLFSARKEGLGTGRTLSVIRIEKQ